MSQVDRQNNLLNDCLESLVSWKSLIEQHLTDEAKIAQNTRLKTIAEDYCKIEFDSLKARRALDETEAHFSGDNPSGTVDEIYRKQIADDDNTLDVQNHVVWRTVFMGASNRDVEEVQQVAEESIPETAYEEVDDSIFCGSVFTPPIDPISQRVIRDPYKNRKCGHIYEYKFILQYIKARKSKAKCPYVGCRSTDIRVTDLVKDDTLRQKINDYVESQPTDESVNND